MATLTQSFMLSSVTMNWLQKHRCHNPSVVGKESPRLPLFGTNIHPDPEVAVWTRCPVQRHKATWTNSTPTTAVWIITRNSRLTDQVGAILSEQHLFPGWGSLRSTRSRADPTGGWRTYSDPKQLNAALKLYPLLSIALKVSRSLTNITEKSSTNPVCSQPKMTETMKSYVLNAAHQQGMNQDSCHSA